MKYILYQNWKKHLKLLLFLFLEKKKTFSKRSFYTLQRLNWLPWDTHIFFSFMGNTKIPSQFSSHQSLIFNHKEIFFLIPLNHPMLQQSTLKFLKKKFKIKKISNNFVGWFFWYRILGAKSAVYLSFFYSSSYDTKYFILWEVFMCIYTHAHYRALPEHNWL